MRHFKIRTELQLRFERNAPSLILEAIKKQFRVKKMAQKVLCSDYYKHS